MLRSFKRLYKHEIIWECSSVKMGSRQDILNLFDRPFEPVFIPKNDAVFNVPSNYVVDKYKRIRNDPSIQNRFSASKTIPVREIQMPDISLPERLGRRDNFSLFVPLHRQMASRLIEVLMGMNSYEDFLSASSYCRDRINPSMFIYALSVAMIHRPDTRNLALPSPCEIFPERYMDSAILSRAREEATVVPDNERVPIELPMDYTATDMEPEHRVAYFREDLGINVHHWHWHLVYPFDGPRNVVNKDRRGELFYYMHEQIQARYNMERLSNKLGLVEKFADWRAPIREAYFPKLDSLVASRTYAPRFKNTVLRDISRDAEQLNFDIQDLERWRDRIYAAINTGTVLDDQGQPITLDETRGIDILGNIVESSILSVNRNTYGDLHNFLHVSSGLVHDPDHKNLETFATIADPATAMRDPIFYRVHAFVDDLFQRHKSTLPRYTKQQLDFPGVKVTGVGVTTKGGANNQISTFWQQSDVDMSRGLDFAPRGPVLVRYTHLQHKPFSYNITVENTGKARTGTVRIFYAPKFNESGQTMFLRSQRLLFVELDKFIVNIKSGKNTFTRDSSQSSVTIPREQTFRDITNSRPPDGTSATDAFNFCGCGWPQHMLVAKGTEPGFRCELFVMVTDFEQDRVDQTNRSDQRCAESASYCGIRDNKYPDRRSMGFPFDRPPRQGVDFLNQFLTPNMKTGDITIKFDNRVELAPGLKQVNRPPALNNRRS